MKKIISIILLAVMYMGLAMPVVSAESYSWNDINTNTGVYISSNGMGMPFRPTDKYASMQNPPDFTWPYVNGAEEYQIKICTDENLSSIKYAKNEIKNNYYNFDIPFETGINYYWSVRYRKNGIYSEWSDARRFRIEPGATVFTVPSVEELANRVPSVHPRVFTTVEKLEEFRKIKDKSAQGERVYNNFIETASRYVTQNTMPDEVPWNQEIWDNRLDSTPGGGREKYLDFMQECKEASGNIINQMYISAFAYLLSGNEEIGNFAKKALVELSGWKTGEPYDADPENRSTTSYAFDDQIYREIAYKSAMAYDWLYGLITDDAEKNQILNMIKVRTAYMANRLTGLEKNPYDSHGWTAIAYIGIVGYSLFSDIPEAKDWYNWAVPYYISVMSPWSYQDGGWSQGTAYWSYSTIESNKEISDVLALGGVIDLYKKAGVVNEPLWVMYAYPKGSYGSFGDGAGKTLSEETGASASSMNEIAYFNKDTLALWLAQDLKIGSSRVWDYYTSDTQSMEAKLPDNKPLSHAFTDIGWAVMTNSLSDENRIQLTFKSSPYGSFNHSHADQNSFIIQAYGEKLAVNSGYYDYYHSPHDKAITRATFSHNSITVDGGKGQVDDCFSAKGYMAQFVSGLEFDSVTGEAAEAYNTSLNSGYDYGGNLDKFNRNIIYLRPNVFVVIDDLDAKGEDAASFDWWLNAEHKMTCNNKSALISEGRARLKADVVYPENITSAYSDTFTNPVDNKEYIPSSGSENANVQTRVCFSTEKLKKTKMVVSMNVYEENDSTKTPVTEYFPEYVKMTYGEGEEETVVLVSLVDADTSVRAGDIQFKGTAVTYSKDTVMLTDGSYLNINGKTLIESDKKITASMGLGQLSLSGNNDFNVILDSMNNFLTITDSSNLKDEKGRSLSAATGIIADSAETADSYMLNISAQKGNYMIINGQNSVISPVQLKAENVSVQKSADGKGGVFWTAKSGRNYDVKINNIIHENAETIPYVFDVTDGVHSICVREKTGKIKGEWSKPIYISSYINEIHDSITFTETTENEKTYVIAHTLGFPSYGCFDMFMAEYDSNGTLNRVTKGEAEGSMYSARIQKTSDTSKIKTFIFGRDVAPLTSAAEYGNGSCTDLLGIFVDGVLVDGFDNAKESYDITFEDERLIFPFVSAQPKDSSSKVNTNYFFDDQKAIVTVTASDGSKRQVVLNFHNNINNIHRVDGAIMEDNFTYDNGTNPGSDGVQPLISNNAVGTLEYKFNGIAESQKYNLYTHMQGNGGGSFYGSRFYSDRLTNSGNYMELKNVPERFKGSDYFVFAYEGFYKKFSEAAEDGNKNIISDVAFKFRLAQKAKVEIISGVKMPELESQGFKQGITSIQGRYMNAVGPEDKYYNINILNRSADELDSNDRIKFYENEQLWVNVLPLDGYDSYEDYVRNAPGADKFSMSNANYAVTSRMLLKYTYSKICEAGECYIEFPDMDDEDDVVIITVGKQLPLSFDEK